MNEIIIVKIHNPEKYHQFCNEYGILVKSMQETAVINMDSNMGGIAINIKHGDYHFYDSDGELQLILNKETVEVTTEDGILTITSDNSNFEVIDENLLEMITDEGEQDVFGIQRIGEINSNSVDIIEWRDLEDND